MPGAAKAQCEVRRQVPGRALEQRQAPPRPPALAAGPQRAGQTALDQGPRQLNCICVFCLLKTSCDFSVFDRGFLLFCRSTNAGRRILKRKQMKIFSTARSTPRLVPSPAICRPTKASTLWRNMSGKHRFLVSVELFYLNFYRNNKEYNILSSQKGANEFFLQISIFCICNK